MSVTFAIFQELVKTMLLPTFVAHRFFTPEDQALLANGPELPQTRVVVVANNCYAKVMQVACTPDGFELRLAQTPDAPGQYNSPQPQTRIASEAEIEAAKKRASLKAAYAHGKRAFTQAEMRRVLLEPLKDLSADVCCDTKVLNLMFRIIQQHAVLEVMSLEQWDAFVIDVTALTLHATSHNNAIKTTDI